MRPVGAGSGGHGYTGTRLSRFTNFSRVSIGDARAVIGAAGIPLSISHSAPLADLLYLQTCATGLHQT